MSRFLIVPCAVLALTFSAGFTRPDPISRAGPKTRELVLAGGCFWGVEAVFEHLRGVRTVTSGYATPTDSSATAAGAPGKGFVEAVRVEFDPQEISYDQLLQVFFFVAHNPTEVDRQGPDVGPRYRSIIFVAGETEHRTVLAYLDSLRSSHAFAEPIVTEVDALRSFKTAEVEHQDFVQRHPLDPYVVQEDLPKLAHLRSAYPALYRD